MMNRFILAGLIIFLAFITLGCHSINPKVIPTKTPIMLETHNPHIRGQITNIYVSEGKISGIFIEGIKEADTVYAKAIVGINNDTHIYIYTGGNFTDSSNLEKSQTVEALFTSPIQTSDPVQANALEIVILK